MDTLLRDQLTNYGLSDCIEDFEYQEILTIDDFVNYTIDDYREMMHEKFITSIRFLLNTYKVADRVSQSLDYNDSNNRGSTKITDGLSNDVRECYLSILKNKELSILQRQKYFYTFFIKNSSMGKEFFDLQRQIILNPELYTNNFLAKHKPSIVGTDEAFALASKILDITDEIAYPLEFPKVVHMKGMIQDWPYGADNCYDHIGFYLNKQGKLKLGNFEQTDIVHYVNKETVTLETVNILEEIAWQKNK